MWTDPETGQIYFSVEEAAELAEVSVSTILSDIESGRLAARTIPVVYRLVRRYTLRGSR
jgi:hypothetical protein